MTPATSSRSSAGDRSPPNRSARLTARARPMSTTSSRRRPLPDADIDPESDSVARRSRPLQLERLQWTVRHAYENVPLYTRKFDEAGVAPDDIRTLDDVQRLPFTTKDDLRQTYPFGMFAVPMAEVRRIHASSGTTGRPTVVGYTAGRPRPLGDARGAVAARRGRPPGDEGAQRLRLRAVHRRTRRARRHRAARRHRHPDVGRTDRAAGAADPRLRAGRDHVHPELPADDRGCDGGCRDRPARDVAARSAILGAEPWTNEMRAEIERRLGIDAVDIYGLSEVMGPGVGNECVETKDGPHIWEDHFLPEIIDDDGATAARTARRGELVFTSLTKEAFPVIRYRTQGSHAAAAGHGAPGDAAHREDHRAQRRHDHPARGEPLPDPDRGARARHRDAHARTSSSSCTATGQLDAMTVRIERHPHLDREVCEAAAAGARPADQGAHRTSVDVRARGAGRAAPQRGQVQAGLRPALSAVVSRDRRAGTLTERTVCK